jgi:hypothetical protein
MELELVIILSLSLEKCVHAFFSCVNDYGKINVVIMNLTWNMTGVIHVAGLRVLQTMLRFWIS